MRDMKKRNMIINICLIVALVGLLAFSIWFSVYIHNFKYHVWLKEYKTQLYYNWEYNKDIHLLDQSKEYLQITLMIIGNVIGYTLLVVGIGINMIFHFKKVRNS